MSRFTFILNPNAGKGAGRRLRKRIVKAVRSRTSDFELVETLAKNDATKIARESPSPSIVAVGGDGTIHEVANGLVGTEKVLGVLPVGSGNDFIKSAGIPRGLHESVECLLVGRVRTIDIGRVEVLGKDPGNSSTSFFVNGLGIGFDAAVAERTAHIPYASGTLLYVLAVLQTLGSYKSPNFKISVDGRSTESKNLLIAIGNGMCAGGGFYLTPRAEVDDGLLDICFIEELSRLGILRLMPKVLMGNHGQQPSVRFDRGQRISVIANQGICVHGDGELLGTSIDHLKVDVVPRTLKVIVR